MTWPVTLKLDSAAYPLNVVQRTAYSLADTVAIQVALEASQISLTAHPAEVTLTLSPEQAHSLILQHLNDFVLRDPINRETAGWNAIILGRLSPQYARVTPFSFLISAFEMRNTVESNSGLRHSSQRNFQGR